MPDEKTLKERLHHMSSTLAYVRAERDKSRAAKENQAKRNSKLRQELARAQGENRALWYALETLAGRNPTVPDDIAAPVPAAPKETQ